MTGNPLLSLRKVSKDFGNGVFGLQDIDLDIAEGEFVSLVGPSGCGKTTTLRVIAGFEKPTSGQVLLQGQEMGPLPPNRRPVNTVFQDYAVFPHMNVAENVGFGLSVLGIRKRELNRRVDEALDLVGADRQGAAPGICAVGRPEAKGGAGPCHQLPAEGAAVGRTLVGA